ncbi:hypothetical protein H9645_06205 [Luteimonas sp. Sa2BVA3]|uniref:Uncharacterized protein n=1 Tax=Luteimonas colneyensis TaxID=2762230 RepID=A0ABR8UHX2_9GAMM|nr:hypothetical protein [Luteimonas colneyensis]MBD7987620.1 hypothetical protein [Luteimonas colneyensis]
MIIIKIRAIGRDGASLRPEIRIPDTMAPLIALEVRMRAAHRPAKRKTSRANAGANLAHYLSTRFPTPEFGPQRRSSP